MRTCRIWPIVQVRRLDFTEICTAMVFVPEYVSINIEDKISLLKLYKSQVSEEWLNRVMSYSYNLIDNSFYERVWTLKATTHRKNFKTSSYVPVAMGQ